MFFSVKFPVTCINLINKIIQAYILLLSEGNSLYSPVKAI